LGAQRYFFAFNDGRNPIFVVGCYIPPNDLEALACVDKAWRECPTGVHPILVGDLNVNLHAPRTKREETIAEQVDAMDLVDMSRHFRQRSGKRLRGRWTWRMRREGRCTSSQCDYFLGRETVRRRFRRVSVRMPRYHSDHRALVAVIYAERGGELKRYRRRTQRFPLSLPRGPRTQLDELVTRSYCSTWFAPLQGSAPPTIGSLTQHGKSSTIAQCCVGRECSPKQQRATSGGKSKLA
jgi:hypothetical protein